MTQGSGCSSITQKNPPFVVEDNSEEIQRNKMHAFLASLTPDTIIDQIIAGYVRMTKSKDFFLLAKCEKPTQ